MPSTDAPSPTARALLALELIQAEPGLTATRLAGALGVSERAARRYVGILREAEIPILSARGAHGGYTVGRGVRLPPLVFSSIEALGLVMAVLEGHHDAADTADPVGNALRKIMRALPEAVAAQAELVRREARPVRDRDAVPPDPTITAALVQASASHRRARLAYRSGSGYEQEVVVEPWAVVARHGRWYLLCRVPARGQLRTYRVDRVRAVSELDERFEPPADLDPVGVLEDNFALGWEFGTEVLIDAPPELVRPLLSRTWGRLEAVDTDHTRLVGSTSDPRWYAEVLAALPMSFRVVGGPELRAAVRELGQRMLAAAGD